MLNEHLWASEKALKRNVFMFLQYTHQNTYTLNLKPCLWSVCYFRRGGNVCFVFAEEPFSYFCNWIGPSLHLSGPRLRSGKLVLGGICEKVPLNPFYLLCYLKTICPHSPMSPAGPFLPLLPRIESGGARHRLLKKSHLARGRGGEVWGGGGLLRVEGVMLGNQNDRQQWKVFCGLPHICEVGWLVSFHSSLWSSGKHWLSHGVSHSLALSVVRSFLLARLVQTHPYAGFPTIAQAFCIIVTTETRWHNCFLQKTQGCC